MFMMFLFVLKLYKQLGCLLQGFVGVLFKQLLECLRLLGLSKVTSGDTLKLPDAVEASEELSHRQHYNFN